MFLRGNRRPLTLILLAALTTTAFVVNVLHFKTHQSHQTHQTRAIAGLRSDATTHKSQSSLQPAYECIYPKVNPFDPQILRLAKLNRPTLTCQGYPIPELTYIDGLAIRVNKTMFGNKAGGVSCRYRNVTRKLYDDNNIVLSDWSEPFTNFINITEEHEFLFAKCYNTLKKNKIVSKAFYSLVPKRAHLVGLYNATIQKRMTEFQPKETLNLIAVGLDGLPRHQMIRAMPKTYKYLTEELHSFDFTMHGQTGGRTFPNMLSLLTANTMEEIDRWWRTDVPEDVFELLWKDFERAGYRTLFTEDYPSGGGFYFFNKTFLNPQTSYWNRPLELLMTKEPRFLWKSFQCMGRRSVPEYHLDYLTRFLDTFPTDPVSCMTMISEITHGDITKASTIDDHILNFYKTLQKKNHLSNSVVMFFSDHGARWGKIRPTYNGFVESRNPFLVLTFPPWFLKKYPEIARNLNNNTRRLTTHFDTRQMLIDLLYFKSPGATPPFRGKHGVSLFDQIPVNRSCEDASIPEDHCLCGKGIDTYLNVTSTEALLYAESLLNEIKLRSNPELCKQYTLGTIIHVASLKQHAYSVRISVKPGGAIFDGTLRFDQSNQRISVNAYIERLTMYKGEVQCLSASRGEMTFCYCKANKS